MNHSQQPHFSLLNRSTCVVATLALISLVGCTEHAVVDPIPGINGTAERLAVDESSTVTHKTVKFNETLSEAATSGKILIVDFGATWCGPCQMLKPEMEKVSARTRDEAIVITIDVDSQSELATHFQVGAIPDIRFFQNGKAVGGIIGFHTADQIIAKLPTK
ncbi:MAG: thioredoxin family protein [Fuerstiella sp.]|jgi:thioredoxin 1|nr:thioredoxin family protein [Fuerstiella sp.]MCP4512803.1 thioredoxin family protein [Fuerstiella sp.]MDG2129779.1 thioredoxin family protein [Fuerstiella sp.]